MSKSQITHGLLCRRALAQAAARAFGIYQLCELRLPSELKAHNRITSTYMTVETEASCQMQATLRPALAQAIQVQAES